MHVYCVAHTLHLLNLFEPLIDPSLKIRQTTLLDLALNVVILFFGASTSQIRPLFEKVLGLCRYLPFDAVA